MLALLVWLPAAAHAHPPLARNLRIVQFAEDDAGHLLAFYRLSLPLLVGGGLADPAPGAPVPSPPYTQGRRQDGFPTWDADIAAIQRDPSGLGRLVLAGHTLTARGQPAPGRLLAAAAHPRGALPPFDTPGQARAAVAAPWLAGVAAPDANDVLVDAEIVYTLPAGARRFELSSTLSAGAVGAAATENLFIDHRGGRNVYYRAAGLLRAPLVVAPGLFEGIASFVLAGVVHILTGPDHLLFLLCLVLGAPSAGALAWRITGFTLGHAATLVAGYYGWVPQPAWFAAAVEAAIAASIVIAGAAGLAGRGGRGMFAVTTALGLVHGLAIAGSLRDVLAADGPNVIQGLAGFNAGVELGQLAVGGLVFAVFRALRRFATTERWVRLGALAAATCVALVWLAERAPAVLQPS